MWSEKSDGVLITSSVPARTFIKVYLKIKGKANLERYSWYKNIFCKNTKCCFSWDAKPLEIINPPKKAHSQRLVANIKNVLCLESSCYRVSCSCCVSFHGVLFSLKSNYLCPGHLFSSFHHQKNKTEQKNDFVTNLWAFLLVLSDFCECFLSWLNSNIFCFLCV